MQITTVLWQLFFDKCCRQNFLHNYIMAEVNLSISRVAIGGTNFV